MTFAGEPAVDPAARPVRGGRGLPLTWLGVTPFFVYVGLFLVLPSVIIASGSFTGKDGGLSLENLSDIQKPFIVRARGYAKTDPRALLDRADGQELD